MGKKEKRFVNREISWLAFNDRVLQEAEDASVPLIERLRFLGIYSNNQDEFFRVRVATLRRVAKLGKNIKDFGSNPTKILDRIQETVIRQQQRFDHMYLQLMEELRTEHICVINEKELSPQQGAWVTNYFKTKVRMNLFPIMIDNIRDMPQLRDTSIFLAVRLRASASKEATRYSLIEIPDTLPRFVEMPEKDGQQYIILLDDVIRYNLSRLFYIFPHDNAEAYTIKFTRDAELDIDNYESIGYLRALEQSLKRRETGDPVRLTYDRNMPRLFLEYLSRKMDISTEEDAVIPGGRYHNFKDFIGFPPLGRRDLLHSRPAPLEHPTLGNTKSIFAAVRKQDVLLHVPYQSFVYILDFVREAAINPKVTEIHMTLYRAASNSAIIRALINAARNGIRVTVVVELQARFDEEANIYWANRMREEGVEVIYGVSKLKVHAKLILVKRQEDDKIVDYAVVGTGNFNEKTAKLYTDFFLLTARPEISKEVQKVFDFFERTYHVRKYKELIVAPFYMRSSVTRLINREIKNAREGKEAWLFFKMNSLVDKKMIKKLYQASEAGVKIRLIVRGTCSLLPAKPPFSANIEAISIVDKYLEHSRVYMSANGGDKSVYIGSGDLMTRNLDFRVEVLVPILEAEIKEELEEVMELQWKDNVKARYHREDLQNEYKKRGRGESSVRSQSRLYEYYQKKAEGAQASRKSKSSTS